MIDSHEEGRSCGLIEQELRPAIGQHIEKHSDTLVVQAPEQDSSSLTQEAWGIGMGIILNESQQRLHDQIQTLLHRYTCDGALRI